MKKLISMLFVAFLVGCSVSVPEATLDKAKTLCKDNGGFKIGSFILFEGTVHAVYATGYCTDGTIVTKIIKDK